MGIESKFKNSVASAILWAIMARGNIKNIISNYTPEELEEAEQLLDQVYSEAKEQIMEYKNENNLVQKPRQKVKLSFDEPEQEIAPAHASFLNKPNVDIVPDVRSNNELYVQNIINNNQDLFVSSAPKVANSNYYGNGFIPNSVYVTQQPKYTVERDINDLGIYNGNVVPEQNDIDPRLYDNPQVEPQEVNEPIINTIPGTMQDLIHDFSTPVPTPNIQTIDSIPQPTPVPNETAVYPESVTPQPVYPTPVPETPAVAPETMQQYDTQMINFDDLASQHRRR